MSFDIFAAHTEFGASVSVHNVQLIDVQSDEKGHELLTIEYVGVTHEVVGGGPWREKYSRHNVGKFGYIVPAQPLPGLKLPAVGFYFRAYIDQSLRRVPELDRHDRVTSDDGRALEIIGWQCDARPNGFRAPVGIIPGEAGCFVPDETVAVTLRVPSEFVRECHRVQMTPQELLRSFVGDLAGVQNLVACPRADNYGSNGSDERLYADAWLDRAHGMNTIDLDELEVRQDENREKQFQREDFAALLDDFEHYGGNADELIATVQALVDKQAEADDEG